MLSVREVPEAGPGGWGSFAMEMERKTEGHSDRGTAEAKAQRLEVLGSRGSRVFCMAQWRDLGGLGSVDRRAWRRKAWPHRACLLESVSENKSETSLLLQNWRRQEIIFKKEIQLLG